MMPNAENQDSTSSNSEHARPQTWQNAIAHSRYLQQRLSANALLSDWLQQHAAAPLSAELMRAELAQAEIHTEDELKQALRQLRQRVMSALILRDIGGHASLAEIMSSMTMLANVTTNFALNFLHGQLSAQFGEVLDQEAKPQRLMIIGMGKLGGGELNVSSDVDYIFVYPEEGESSGTPDGGKKIDAYDFFNRLGKRLITALGEITGDGQVFRVDMRLRPNGDSGPLVCSLDSLENYLITQGREWERYAWIKARVMNEGENEQAQWISALKKITRPFIYRKYLDFGAINAMRDLHAQIRREVTRKDMAEHIKLGPGGIREIEFIAQVFQLIRGGRDEALQIRPTLSVLPLLAERRLIPAENVEKLMSAYTFLRRLEHRLQYMDDAQTHMLPNTDADRLLIATSMGHTDWPNLLCALDQHRQYVSSQFAEVFSEPDADTETHALTELWLGQLSDETEAINTLSPLGFSDPKAMHDRLCSFRSSAKYVQLPASNRERLDAIAPRLIEAASATTTPDVTLLRGLDFFETISRRGAYLALLQQHPQALSKVAEIISSSSWAAHYLTHHPILLDEILDPRLYEIATDWLSFQRDLQARLDSVSGDTEREMDVLREAHHAQVFRLLAQDIAGLQTLEQLADHLSTLADIVVQKTLTMCWEKLKERHPHPSQAPKFAVIAYGKLGGKELAYGSDLDLVFLHNDPEPGAGELYARLGQRMNSWMSSQTSAGILFETDFRLRPNGDAGMLVSPLEGFYDYQRNHAWAWEHQALTRARFCAGDAEIGAQFAHIRSEILRQPRNLDTLKTDVLAMRQRMLDAHASNNEALFDLKQDPGGLIDVEFIVQYLILGHAHAHASLCENIGNTALLGLAASLALIPQDLAQATQTSYREYRRQQHALRLNGNNNSRVERASQIEHIQAVTELWSLIFN